MENFLKLHRANKTNGLDPTHNRIAVPNIPKSGGSFHLVGNVLPAFFDQLYKKVILEESEDYLVEKQYQDGVMYIDLDFKHPPEIDARQFNKDWVDDFIYAILDKLKKYYQLGPDNQFKCYILQRDGVRREKDHTKDGLHIIFGLNIHRKIHSKIRKEIIEEQTELFNRLNIKNDHADVYDKALVDKPNCVQLYGCRKPGCQPYKLVRIIQFGIAADDHEWTQKNESFTNPISKELFYDLNVRIGKYMDIPTPTQLGLDISNPEQKIIREIDAKKPTFDIGTEGAESLENLAKLMQCYHPSRIDEYSDWAKLAWAISNCVGKEGKSILLGANAKVPHRNTASAILDAETFYDAIEPRPLDAQNALGWGSLHKWAKTDNPHLYHSLFPRTVEKDAIDELNILFNTSIKDKGTHTGIARYFCALYPNKFVCTNIDKKIYWQFTENNLWESKNGATTIRKLISNNMREYYLAEKIETDNLLDRLYQEEVSQAHIIERITEKQKTLEKIIANLENTSFKNSLLLEISDLIFDANFETDMNKQLYILPIKGKKVIDMRTLETSERTTAHKFSFECNSEWRTNTPEQDAYCAKYFSDLFCGRNDTALVVLNLIKTMLIGKPMRKVLFHYGSGKNGKSLLFTLLGQTFGEFVKTISAAVIIKKNNSSPINTEVEKLDKCRIALTTEMEDTDKLNESSVKQISGGDAINFRGLHKTDCEIHPTCTANVPSNNLPSFDIEQALLDRIIVVPFKNKFDAETTFKDQLLSRTEWFFNYILSKAIIYESDNFEITDEMKAAKQDYVEGNIDSTLTAFLESDEIKMDTEARIGRDDFIDKYKSWCRGKGKTIRERNSTQFTKAMTACGISNTRSNGRPYFIGIKWIPYSERSKEEETTTDCDTDTVI